MWWGGVDGLAPVHARMVSVVVVGVWCVCVCLCCRGVLVWGCASVRTAACHTRGCAHNTARVRQVHVRGCGLCGGIRGKRVHSGVWRCV